MELVQARLVTDDVARLAAFYAKIVAADVPINDYYVEIPAGYATVGFSKRRFTEYRDNAGTGDRLGTLILDFEVADADAEYERIAALDVE